MVLALAVFATVAFVVLLLAPAGQAADPARGDHPVVVVRSGDTLWDIARRHAPRRDRVATVDEIRRLNRLDGYVVFAGQQLVLPRVR